VLNQRSWSFVERILRGPVEKEELVIRSVGEALRAGRSVQELEKIYDFAHKRKGGYLHFLALCATAVKSRSLSVDEILERRKNNRFTLSQVPKTGSDLHVLSGKRLLRVLPAQSARIWIDLFYRGFPVEPIISKNKMPRARFEGTTARVFSRFAGFTLTEFNHRFPERVSKTRRDLQKQATELLSTLYAQGIIHGHPSPSNWVVQHSRNGVKMILIDWDAARRFSPTDLKSKEDLKRILDSRKESRFSEMNFLIEMGRFFGNSRFPQNVVNSAWKKISEGVRHG
jgi:hypothetical protein